MRSNWRPSEPARAFAMLVFATPGTPSRRTCPPAKRQASMSLSSSVLPTMTFETSARIRSERPFTCAAWLVVISSDASIVTRRQLSSHPFSHEELHPLAWLLLAGDGHPQLVKEGFGVPRRPPGQRAPAQHRREE